MILQKLRTCHKKDIKCIVNIGWMPLLRTPLALRCGKGLTEPQNFANLTMSSFAEEF